MEFSKDHIPKGRACPSFRCLVHCKTGHMVRARSYPTRPFCSSQLLPPSCPEPLRPGSLGSFLHHQEQCGPAHSNSRLYFSATDSGVFSTANLVRNHPLTAHIATNCLPIDFHLLCSDSSLNNQLPLYRREVGSLVPTCRSRSLGPSNSHQVSERGVCSVWHPAFL